MTNNIYFLSGLPRTGSTLLTSILSQNPEIHTEGNSALCQLMWDMKVSLENTEQVSNRPDITEKMMKCIPQTFYQSIDNNIIDKCRSWTLPANLELIENYITKTPKIVVMVRPLLDIVKSFVYIRTLNGWDDPEFGLLDYESEPIMRSLYGVQYAKSIDNGQFLFIEYDDLVDNTEDTINKIYDFYGWNRFSHNLKSIINNNPEDDLSISMIGLHDIRSSINRRNVNVKLSDHLYEKILQIESMSDI